VNFCTPPYPESVGTEVREFVNEYGLSLQALSDDGPAASARLEVVEELDYLAYRAREQGK
jgi:hypothetical protein